MLNIMQSYKKIELKKRLMDHKDSDKLIPIVKSFYKGDVENIYYFSDRGDIGESPECINLHICMNGMAVFVGTMVKFYGLSWLSESYVKENNILTKDGKTYYLSLDFSSFNILEEPLLKSDYTLFLNEVKNNFLEIAFERVKEKSLEEMINILNNRLIENQSILSVQYNKFTNRLVAIKQNDGSYFVDRLISINLKSDKSIYSYPVYISESYVLKSDIKKSIEDILTRIPSNEYILKKEEDRKRR